MLTSEIRRHAETCSRERDAVRGVALLLLRERLHDADAGQPFLQRRHRVGDAVAQREERGPRALAIPERRPGEQRQRDQHHEREERREGDEDHDGDDEQQHRADHLDEHLAREGRERLDVRGET